jgi:ribose 5-phosphate isomerase A
VTVDGADEVDPRGRLVKGHGGALLREKIVACASRSLVIAIDESKRVDALGTMPLPIEIVRFAAPLVMRWLAEQGARPVLRRDAAGTAFVTDEGHVIADCTWDRIDDPEALADRLDRRVGVVEHGLFLGFNPHVIVGTASDL